VSKKIIKNWLTDMDGVLIHEQTALPGANEFITTLREREIPFLVLT
jgi:NagD protein